VKEQTRAYLDKARELLDEADVILSVNRHEAAGRAAYMAGFHAAQAVIFETSGRIFKSHGGLQGEFQRMVRSDPRVSDDIRAFLGRTYNLKAIADYLIGPGSHISPEMAHEAVDSAHRFVECVAGLMPTPQLDLSDAERDRILDDIRNANAEREQDHERDGDRER
jgi:uncharacterized protein (UPF0332 family)